MKSSRNLWLDTLRGVAALAVAFHHFNAHTKHTGNLFNVLTGYGSYGVMMFFFISGFCIQSAAYRARSLTEFLWHRFWRIYPPYFFSLLVLFGVAALRKLIVGVNDATRFSHSLSDWLATLAVMTAPATPVKVMNWVYWTLSYEVIFYLIVGVTMVSGRYRFMVYYLITGLSFINILSTIPGLFFLKYWAIFCLGIGLLEYTRGNKLHGVLLMLVSSVRVLSLFDLVANAIIFTTFATTLIAIFRPESVLCRRNWLSRVGTVSYSLYLLHVPIGVFLFAGLQQALGLQAFPLNIPFYLALAALCIGCAYIAFVLVEKPSMEIGKKFDRVNSWLTQKHHNPAQTESPAGNLPG